MLNDYGPAGPKSLSESPNCKICALPCDLVLGPSLSSNSGIGLQSNETRGSEPGQFFAALALLRLKRLRQGAFVWDWVGQGIRVPVPGGDKSHTMGGNVLAY